MPKKNVCISTKKNNSNTNHLNTINFMKINDASFNNSIF